MSTLDDGAHAVRWARRKVRNEYDYTQWHWTARSMWTLCNCIIALANDGGTFLPETDDDIETVTCKHCLRILKEKPKDENPV